MDRGTDAKIEERSDNKWKSKVEANGKTVPTFDETFRSIEIFMRPNIRRIYANPSSWENLTTLQERSCSKFQLCSIIVNSHPSN